LAEDSDSNDDEHLVMNHIYDHPEQHSDTELVIGDGRENTKEPGVRDEGSGTTRYGNGIVDVHAALHCIGRGGGLVPDPDHLLPPPPRRTLVPDNHEQRIKWDSEL
jgi:hypothetical protein